MNGCGYYIFFSVAGIQKLVDWCEKTNYARSLKRVERYQNNYSVHKAGDVKSTYYLLDTEGYPNVCRSSKKRYFLKDF